MCLFLSGACPLAASEGHVLQLLEMLSAEVLDGLQEGVAGDHEGVASCLSGTPRGEAIMMMEGEGTATGSMGGRWWVQQNNAGGGGALGKERWKLFRFCSAKKGTETREGCRRVSVAFVAHVP